MNHKLKVYAISVMILGLLTLIACNGVLGTPSTLLKRTPFLPSTETSVVCGVSAQENQAFASTREKATAEKFCVNAQTNLDSSNATLSAVQTQDQNNANVIAAQIASTSEFERANAQATLYSTGSTQSAALTRDTIRETQMANQVTVVATATQDQQNKDNLAAGNQTAFANNFATQTQATVATSQWFTDQARQRVEQRQAPLTFLWLWCLLPLVVFAGLALWGFWRWRRIPKINQRILENPVDKLPASKVEVLSPSQKGSSPYLENDVVDRPSQLTKPGDQLRRWLDEVKRKLRRSDKKDEDDNSDN